MEDNMLRNLENFLAEIEISWCFHDTISLVPLFLTTLVEFTKSRWGGGGEGRGHSFILHERGLCFQTVQVFLAFQNKKGLQLHHQMSWIGNVNTQESLNSAWIYGGQSRCWLSILNIVLSVICGSIGWICHPIKDIVWVKLGSELDLTMGQSIN